MHTHAFWHLLRTTAIAASAVALLAAATPAAAQPRQNDQQLSWAAAAVERALNRNIGSEAYWDAMKRVSRVLARHGLVSYTVEDYFDRRESNSDWDWFSDESAIYPRFHDQVMAVLSRNRGTWPYYRAMEAAADELDGEDMLSGSVERFFDRRAGEAAGYGYPYALRADPGYGTWGYYGYPGYAAR